MRIIATSLGDLEKHLTTLRSSAEHPDRIFAERAVRSRVDQDRILNEIRALVRQETKKPRIVGSGPTSEGVVSVRVLHGEDALAQELKRRYGDAVRVTFADVARRF